MNSKVDNQINELLQKMSIREKIGQLNMTVTPKTEAEFERTREKLRNGDVGSMILASSSTAGLDPQERVNTAMCNRVQKVAMEEGPHGIPLIYGRDVIHGHRTVYPVPLAIAAAFNDELVKKAYRYTAIEATSVGIHWTFAPMIDLCRDPRYGRIIEGPGEDPMVGRHMARAIVEGFQNGDVAQEDSMVTCPKHFIGYGASEGGRDYYRTEISDYSLYNYYLPAFREAIEAGSDTVMSSFNDINGDPVSGSRYYMTEILRDYLGFKGFVVSDWGAIAFLKRLGVTESESECAELGIHAGIEIDMCDDIYVRYLEKLIEEGKVSMETLDNAVRRVLEVKFKKNLFENPYCKMPEIDRTEHLKCARELASECMVLLKNEDNVLPLSKDKKIALLGPLVHEKRALLGSWCLEGKAEETPSFYEAMVEAVGKNHLITATDPTGLYDDSVRAMYQADVVVLALGESEKVTGEKRSLADISLPNYQIELIRKAKYSGKKVIGVFFCGRPIAMEGVADLLDAVLYAWHSGSEAAGAACDILFGETVPSGKTAITFPRNSGHIPMYYNATSNRYNGYFGNNSETSYEDSIAAPYYPFGYGLSYTEFAYSNMQSDCAEISVDDLKNGKKVKCSIDVSNVGEYEGKETIQLYIHDVAGTYMRPFRELKDYKKLLFKVGETKNITFELGYDELGYYMPDGAYVVEEGNIEVFIGPNCFAKDKIVLKVV
ncbi:MAG: glycoside hydrolase family 3 C-terminal domain-containing protein [Tyzzerella sp.]|nr:glycoside hydrolase family 3 C-terminal domain-containing protein [Tyzzerella sp.]